MGFSVSGFGSTFRVGSLRSRVSVSGFRFWGVARGQGFRLMVGALGHRVKGFMFNDRGFYIWVIEFRVYG